MKPTRHTALTIALSTAGAALALSGCQSAAPARADTSRSVTAQNGAIASADPIGASLFAQPSNLDSPRPVLATAPTRD